jgi:hypothetical protein
MAIFNKDNEEGTAIHSFHFSLTGLIIFSLCLMAGAAFVSSKLFSAKPKPFSFANNDIPAPGMQDKDRFTRKGPWGELLTQNIRLERPAEYIPAEVENPEPVTWTFTGMNLAQVKALLTANGLSRAEVEAQLTPSRVAVTATNTVFTPDEDFLLSLKPETRQKLYGGLYGLGVETFIDYPLIFPKDSIETIYADERLHPDEVALLKRLVYPAANSTRLADDVLFLRKIPTAERRVVVAKVVSVQSAVLVRLCIRPDCDIEKIAAYWGHMDNVRFADLRPMLEALKGLPHGGTMSLMYFLPPFARSRLYTFPLPPEPGDPLMDCHWTTFNFSKTEPDNRFNGGQFANDYIRENFHPIDAPSQYGDVVLYVDEKMAIKHSAVFLADDLAFTKYGANYRQPWMIVRLSDMHITYPTTKEMYIRRNTK